MPHLHSFLGAVDKSKSFDDLDSFPEVDTTQTPPPLGLVEAFINAIDGPEKGRSRTLALLAHRDPVARLRILALADAIDDGSRAIYISDTESAVKIAGTERVAALLLEMSAQAHASNTSSTQMLELRRALVIQFMHLSIALDRIVDLFRESVPEWARERASADRKLNPSADAVALMRASLLRAALLDIVGLWAVVSAPHESSQATAIRLLQILRKAKPLPRRARWLAGYQTVSLRLADQLGQRYALHQLRALREHTMLALRYGAGADDETGVGLGFCAARQGHGMCTGTTAESCLLHLTIECHSAWLLDVPYESACQTFMGPEPAATFGSGLAPYLVGIADEAVPGTAPSTP